MIKPENRNQMVRGYVVSNTRDISVVAKDNPDCITAYTHWYRHDENLGLLEKEVKKLADLYMSFEKTSGISIGYEYKEYRR